MAIYYLSDVDGSDSDDGLSKANAKATWAGVVALGLAAGDIVRVDSRHVDDQASAAGVDAVSGSIDNPCIMVSWDWTNDVPLAGAIINVAAATNAAINLLTNATAGKWITYGVTFRPGTGNNSANKINIFGANNVNQTLEMYGGGLSIQSQSGSAQFVFPVGAANTAGKKLLMVNCNIELPNATQAGSILLGQAEVELVNPTFSYSGGSKPTSIFAQGNVGTSATKLTIRDGNISGIDSGALLNIGNFTRGTVLLKNLRHHASMSITTGTFPSSDAAEIIKINVDSGDTINVFQRITRLATADWITTVYPSDGAQHYGVSGSLRIVTTAAANEGNPFKQKLRRIIDASDTFDVAVEVFRNNATDLTDRNSWLDLSKPASASFPNYSVSSNRNAAPFSGSAVDHGNSATSWTDTGSNDNPQTMAISSVTASEKGFLEAEYSHGVASDTVYLDPTIRLDGDVQRAVMFLDDGSIMSLSAGGGGGGTVVGDVFGSLIIR